MGVIAFDWSETSLAYFAETNNNDVLKGKVDISLQALTALSKELKKIDSEWIALIETGSPIVEEILFALGAKVKRIAASKASGLRKALSASAAKDDARDARLLLKSFKTTPEDFVAYESDEKSMSLYMLLRHQFSMENERIRAFNRLRSHLVETQPALAKLDLTHPVTLYVLEKCPHPQTPKGEVKRMISSARKKYPRHRPDVDAINAAFADRLAVKGAAANTAAKVRKHLVEALILFIESEKQAVNELMEEAKKHPDYEIIRTLPGTGDKLASQLTACFVGLRLNPNDSEHIVAIAGCSPVTIQSGKSRAVLRRHNYNRIFSKIMFNLVLSSLGNVAWIKEWYNNAETRRAGRGRLWQTGRKLLRILCAMLRDGKNYQPGKKAQAANNIAA